MFDADEHLKYLRRLTPTQQKQDSDWMCRIVTKFSEQYPTLKFLNITRLVEKDTVNTINTLQQHPLINCEQLHDMTHFKKIMIQLHTTNNHAFLIENTPLVCYHPSLHSMCLPAKEFTKYNCKWCILHSDNVFVPFPDMNTDMAVRQAVSSLFLKDCCPICMESLQDKPTCFFFECEHLIHLECGKNFLKSNDNVRCPMCRAGYKNRTL